MDTKSSRYPVDLPTRLELALEAGTTPESILNALRGRRMKPTLFRRIRQAFDARGLGHVLPAQPAEGSTG
jgi:hypothetical protein